MQTGTVLMMTDYAELPLVKTCLIIFMFVSHGAFGYERGDKIVRAGYANIDFREDSGPVRVNDQFDLGELSVESQRTPLITFATMYNRHLGIEILVPFSPLELKANGKGGFIDRLPMGTADVWLMAITFQYYPLEFRWAKPYLGVGANYAIIKNEHINGSTAHALGIERIESVDADNSTGMIYQVGVDIPITHDLIINLSTTFVELNLDATATVYANDVPTKVTTQMGLKKLPNVTVVGISYRF